jgi:hypothetical protein
VVSGHSLSAAQEYRCLQELAMQDSLLSLKNSFSVENIRLYPYSFQGSPSLELVIALVLALEIS